MRTSLLATVLVLGFAGWQLQEHTATPRFASETTGVDNGRMVAEGAEATGVDNARLASETTGVDNGRMVAEGAEATGVDNARLA